MMTMMTGRRVMKVMTRPWEYPLQQMWLRWIVPLIEVGK